MKTANRVIFVLSILCAALGGGLLATVFAPQPVEAADAAASPAALAFGPQVNISTLPVPFVTSSLITSTYAKVADVGTFTVENAASLVEVTHQGRLYASNIVSTSGVYLQLRVDNQLPLSNSGEALIREPEETQYVPLTFSGYWQDLSTGQHTVSIWAQALFSGSGYITMNPGNWASNDVIIKEYLPFGTTYLPSIVR